MQYAVAWAIAFLLNHVVEDLKGKVNNNQLSPQLEQYNQIIDDL